jgi:hypothetical protein
VPARRARDAHRPYASWSARMLSRLRDRRRVRSVFVPCWEISCRSRCLCQRACAALLFPLVRIVFECTGRDVAAHPSAPAYAYSPCEVEVGPFRPPTQGVVVRPSLATSSPLVCVARLTAAVTLPVITCAPGRVALPRHRAIKPEPRGASGKSPRSCAPVCIPARTRATPRACVLPRPR